MIHVTHGYPDTNIIRRTAGRYHASHTGREKDRKGNGVGITGKTAARWYVLERAPTAKEGCLEHPGACNGNAAFFPPHDTPHGRIKESLYGSRSGGI